MSCHISLIALGTVANAQQTTHDDNCESIVMFADQKCHHESPVDRAQTCAQRVPSPTESCVPNSPPYIGGEWARSLPIFNSNEPEKMGLPWLPFAQRDDSTRGLGLAVKLLSQLPEVTP